MELNRLVRLVRARWWLFVVVAGVGLVSGFFFTSVRNGQIKPEFAATARVIVDRDEGSTDRAFESKVVDALDLAITVNGELNPTLDRIQVANDDQAAIVFKSVRSNVEEASVRAEEMRRIFLDSAESVFTAESGQTDDRLGAIDLRLAEIEETLGALELRMAGESALATDSASTLALLQNQLAAVDGELSSRYTERLIGPDTTTDETRTAADVVEEIAVLEDESTRLRAEIAALQPAIPATRNPDTRLQEQLNAEYTSLQAEWNLLTLTEAAVGVRPFGTLEAKDQTDTPSSAPLNAVFGLVAGAIAAFGLVVTEDRYRQIVWVGSDLRSMPLLGEVAARRTAAVPGQPWYELGGPPARKRAVQAIRVTVEGAVSGSSSTLGFMGLSTPSADVHELAADFAMSMVTSGSRVLLLDADFEKPSGLVEFSGEGATLSDMLSHRMDDEESYRSFVKGRVTEPAEVHPGLIAIQVGRGLADPADALAGRRLQLLLEEVKTIFDVVVIAGGDVRDSASQALVNRMNNIILALRPGKASVTAVETVRTQLATFGLGVLGTALVLAPGRSGSGAITVGPDTEPPSSRHRGDEPQDVLVEALLREREKARKGEKDRSRAPALGAGEPTDAPLAVSSVNVNPEASLRIIPSITPSTSTEVAEQVARLIEETTDSVLRGYSGSSAAQRVDPGIKDVTKYGFVPLVRIKGHRSLGARVLDALYANLDDAEQREVAADFVEFFEVESGGRMNERVAGAINKWVMTHYFTRHLATTGREPTVWHVSSPRGTFQALVHSTKCTRERIDLLRSEILRRQMDTLNRTLKAAIKSKRFSHVRRLEEQIKDQRTFDIALGWLYEGTTPNARLWYPWKGPEAQPQGWDPHLDEGIRANVAPLQRLGILVQDVLTGEELLAFSPPS